MDARRLKALRQAFGDRLQEQTPLAGFTSARIGGPAAALLIAGSADELEQAVLQAWKLDLPMLLLGAGSNVLVSDAGYEGVVVINRTRRVVVDAAASPAVILAESGASMNDVAQRAARHNLTGLEWAASIPGSLGGAVYGNAGAFGGEMAGSLISLTLVHRDEGRLTWPAEKMAYSYRSSLLKRDRPPVVILEAVLGLQPGDPELIRARMADFSERRRAAQPGGASMGSMFKNPTGSYAGKLIAEAGLKGARIGNAEISGKHANFFICNGRTRAADVKALIDLAQKTVLERSGVRLELEIELIGKWEA